MAGEGPNSQNDWKLQVAPLDALDPILLAFAAAHGLTLERNVGSWSGRTFRVATPICCAINVYLDGTNDGKWYFWISASDELDGGHYWKRRTLKGPVEVDELGADMAELLVAAWDEICTWPASTTR
jgi:hypothetical protein